MRSPALPRFGALSVALHAAVWVAVGHGPAAPRPSFDPASQPLAGDTLEVEPAAPAEEEEESEPDETTPAPPAPTAPAEPGERRAARHRLATHAPRPADAASSATVAAAPPPALFGAVGVRSAADLATTFTRAFPQAASADRLWTEVAYGPAGTAEVTLALDDAGRLASQAVAGSPSPALRRGIERALVLLGSRPFTARAAVTRLRVRARVGRDDMHDGLHGDVFALSGGSFRGDVGTAFFALPPSTGPGRRVDVEVQLLP